MPSLKFAVIGLLFLLSGIFAGCSHPVSMASYPGAKNIKIDGMDDEWEKDRMEVIEDAKIAVGIVYDNDYMYLGMAPLDRSIAMQIMAMGFTVWFDSTGKGNKILGIRYPIGMGGRMPMQLTGDQRENGNLLDDRAKKQLNEVEIIGPGKLDRTRLTQYELTGLAVKLTHQKDGMFYELKIPLRPSDNFPYGINAVYGKPMSVLLETNEFKKPEFGGRMPGGPGGGIMPAGGMQMGGPPEMPKKLKVLIITNLKAM